MTWLDSAILACLLVSAIFETQKLFFKGGKKKTLQARIVDVNERPGQPLTKLFRYRVQYLFEGRKFTAELVWEYWYPTIFKTGEVIAIAIDPDDPAEPTSLSAKGKLAQVTAHGALIVIFFSGLVHFLERAGLVTLSDLSHTIGIGSLACLILAHLIREIKLLSYYNKFAITKGSIVDFAEGKDADLDTIFFPIVEFHLAGNKYRFISKAYVFQREISKEVDISYLEANPQIAEIRSSARYWGVVFWSVVQVVFLVVATLYFERYNK